MAKSLRATAGQIAANLALPEEFRDYGRTLDRPGLTALMAQIAQEKPEAYREAAQKLSDLGHLVAYRSGHYAPTLDDLKPAASALAVRTELHQKMHELLADRSLNGAALAKAIVGAVGPHQGRMAKAIYAESLAEKNPLGLQVASGARGSAANLAALRGSDLLYSDQHDQIVPVPILRSFSEGLSPAEYLAGAFGARKGIIGTKLAVARGGYLSKLLSQVQHRLIVTQSGDAEDDDDGPLRGLPVPTADRDNVGSLLAASAGPYRRNTVLTPKILDELQKKGHEHILVRSPIAGEAADGGLRARDLGLREFGRLAAVGENPGMVSGGALAEPIAQGALGAKHSAGVVGQGRTASGFDLIEQMLQVPKNAQGRAAHAQEDGRVKAITPAAAGGWTIQVGSREHYVPAESAPLVHEGQDVEAGDVLSEGEPNPAEIARHKGIGEGRRYLATALRDTLRATGGKAHRRNTELAARGLIDHVKMTEEHGEYVPGDIAPYSVVARSYQPRADARDLAPGRAEGKYLETPVLHYTIGTKIRPSTVRMLERFAVPAVHVHDEPPPFESLMVRAADNLRHDPDPLTRMYSSNLEKGFLSSVHRGGVSDEAGTSFVPGLARSVGFGTYGKVRPPALPAPEKHAAVNSGGQPLGAPGPKLPKLPAPPKVPGIPKPALPPAASPSTPLTSGDNPLAAGQTQPFASPHGPLTPSQPPPAPPTPPPATPTPFSNPNGAATAQPAAQPPAQPTAVAPEVAPQYPAGLAAAAADPHGFHQWLNTDQDPVGAAVRLGTLVHPKALSALTGGPNERTTEATTPDYAAEEAQAGHWNLTREMADAAKPPAAAPADSLWATSPGNGSTSSANRTIGESVGRELTSQGVSTAANLGLGAAYRVGRAVVTNSVPERLLASSTALAVGPGALARNAAGGLVRSAVSPGSLALGGVIDAGLNAPDAVRNYLAGGQYDPGKFEERSHAGHELANANVAELALSTLTPATTLANLGTAGASEVDQAQDAYGRARDLDYKQTKLKTAPIDATQNTRQRDTKGWSVGDRVGYDYAYSPLRVPGYQPFRIPGTDWKVPALFGPAAGATELGE